MMHSTLLRRLAVFWVLFLTAFRSVAPASQLPDLSRLEWQEEQLAPGALFRQAQVKDLFGAPQFICLLAVETQHPRTRIRFAAAHQFGMRDMTTPELAEKAGALAAINGGFFDVTTNANCGILKIDGKVFPFTKRESEELLFVGSSAVGLDKRGRWHFMVRQKETWDEDWKDMRHALAGGHPLVLNGKIVSQIDREAFDPRREQRHAGGRNPRTAIGVTTNQVALLITLDGRHAGEDEGVTLRQLAQLMQTLGCDNAINLDGGGSTTMWLRGRGIVNHPCDNGQFDHAGARRVRTAVVLVEK